MEYKDIRNNTFSEGKSIVYESSIQETFISLMRKVYLWMTLALLITGLTSYFTACSSTIMITLLEHSYIVWGLLAVELIVVLILSGRVHKLSIVQATTLFVLYSIINGITLSFIFLAYEGANIAKAFIITSGTFCSMSIYGYTTKKNLATIGKYFYMALLGLIIATIVNLFMGSSLLDMIICYTGVIIFVGLTAWDTQKIKRLLIESSQYGVNEGNMKIALLGALSLYLDFMNLFLYILRIMGKKK